MESDEKVEFRTALKEIKIPEEPQYETMKVDQQDYFIKLDEYAYEADNGSSEDCPPVQMTTLRHTARKYKNIDFWSTHT